MNASKKVLVTGGAGYIGSHTCKALASAGYEPVVYDNLSTGHDDFVQWGPLVKADILDTQTLCDVIERYSPAGIIHFAAFIEVGESVRAPGKFYKNNVGGTLSILEAMRRTNLASIVVSGTCAVYGAPASTPIDEDAPHNPLSPYGAAKSMMERILADYENAYGVRSATMRYFNASGADSDGMTGERHVPESHLIPRVFMAASGEIPSLTLFGDDYPTPDGTCLRDYIHVEDLASAHILALEKLIQGSSGIKLNLGAGKGYSVKEIIEKSEQITGKKVPYSIQARRPGDSPALVGKVDRAETTLGWRACHSSLENILSTAWNWFVKDTPERRRALSRNALL